MRRILAALLTVVGMVSCDTDLVKSGYKTTQGGAWNKDSIIAFTFSELDTLNTYDIFINLRNDNSYPYDNLFIIAELDFPSGETETDTLEYEMAKPDGTWLGKGYGSLLENKLWYRENILFPSGGMYTMRLSHAMRRNGSVDGIVNLEGITDVGFEIVKHNQ